MPAMRQKQLQQEPPRVIQPGEEEAAKIEYVLASAKAVGICFLVFGSLTLSLILNHLPPFRKFSLLDDFPRAFMFIAPSMLIGHLYGRWVCRRKGLSLERQESTTWRRKPTAPMEKTPVFALGSSRSLNRIVGALGIFIFLVYLTLVTWMTLREGIGPRPGLPPERLIRGWVVSVVLVVVTFGLGVAGLVMSLTALRSGGEPVQVDSEGISWVRGGVRYRALWSRLARAEVTRGYDVKGELAKLEIRLFDNEDEPQGTLIFGAERPKSMSPTTQSWPEQLEDFHDQFRNTFDTPR